MKRKVILIALGVLLLGLVYASLAQPQRPGQRGPRAGQGRRAAGPGAVPMAPCALHCSMASALMHKAVASTPEGGALVLAGNKLMRYDANLTLTKTIEIKVDEEAYQTRIQAMMDACPVCGAWGRLGPPAPPQEEEDEDDGADDEGN